jgi:hypothetical protein
VDAAGDDSRAAFLFATCRVRNDEFIAVQLDVAVASPDVRPMIRPRRDDATFGARGESEAK